MCKIYTLKRKKTNVKWLSKQIISIFFLISAICFPERLFAAVSVAPGLALEKDESGYDREYLQGIVRQLDRYGRMSKLRRSQTDIIIVQSLENFIGFGRGGRLWIPGNSNDWISDALLRRKLIALLASHRFGFNCPADSPGVPWWILYGLEAEIAAGATSGQYLVANRDYRLLSEFCAVNGKMPDFAAMCRMGEIREPVMLRFAGEQARLLLLIMAENGRIGELFRKVCQGGKPDVFVGFYASAGEAQQQISARAEELIWNRYHPMPADAALKRLPELTCCFIPKTDARGVPGTDFIECKWEEFADLLRHPRTDNLSLRKRFAANFIAFGKMLPAGEAAICNDLAAAAMSFGIDKDPDAVKERFRKKLAELERACKRRTAIENYLRSVLLMRVPVPDSYRFHFDAVKEDVPVAGEEQMRFLRQVMLEYLQ